MVNVTTDVYMFIYMTTGEKWVRCSDEEGQMRAADRLPKLHMYLHIACHTTQEVLANFVPLMSYQFATSGYPPRGANLRPIRSRSRCQAGIQANILQPR
jgi:hypothetical protein